LEFIFSYRLGAREDSIAQDLRSIFPIQATAKVSPVPLRKDTGRCLTVDLLTSLIADTEKIVNVQSREFASVFQGFNASESMPSSDFVKLVWGFSSFNPERHLDRMKSFFRKFNSEFDGWARLGIRDGKVLLKLQNVRVDLVHATQHVLDVARVFAGVGLDTQFEHSASTPTTAKRSADLTAPTTKGSSWSRVDFQNYWGLSKTSTVLRIQNHLKAGAIERKGVGKSSVYSVLDPVVFEI
jgi:hypothetical protein